MITEEAYPTHGEEDLERALGMLDGFLASQLWNDLQQARRVLAEHPVAWKTEDGTVVRGTIDLLFRSDDGWRVVDYKTAAIGSAEGLEIRLDGHRYVAQVRRYMDAWESITGEPVAEGGLWFVEKGAYLDIGRP
jgi:ATP-dependent exoDNAse (exonuclease V) beta subunit